MFGSCGDGPRRKQAETGNARRTRRDRLRLAADGTCHIALTNGERLFYTTRTNGSDYIVYVDESGDHSLTSIDPNYPIFVVAFAIFEKATYANAVKHLLKLKFDTFGHDMVVMHERDIRKRRGDFAFVRDPLPGPRFLTDLTSFVQNATFTLVAAVIRKTALVAQYAHPDNPMKWLRHLVWNEPLASLKTCIRRRVRLTLSWRAAGEEKIRIWNYPFVARARVTTSGAFPFLSKFDFPTRDAIRQECSWPIWSPALSGRKPSCLDLNREYSRSFNPSFGEARKEKSTIGI